MVDSAPGSEMQPARASSIVSGHEENGSVNREFARGNEGPFRHISLLTPYTGGNLGDAAIQDAMIANLRCRLPQADFCGVTLNGANFLERHGGNAFPLCAVSRSFYGMSRESKKRKVTEQDLPEHTSSGVGLNSAIKERLGKIPLAGRWLKAIFAKLAGIWRELRHSAKGYHLLRGQDLIVVSGGGQLDEEWGGSWGHPFTLFKWAVLARMARIPFAVVSVGACKTASATSRFFLSSALRLARYRSYRDKNSRVIAAGLFPRAADDVVIPDLAFSLSSQELPAPAGIRSLANGRRIIAVSPIAYAKPQNWPWQDRALFDRYVRELARAMSQLLARDAFLVLVYSSVGDDDGVIPEVLAQLDAEARRRRDRQLIAPTITTWNELVALFLDVDCVVASRLHSVILSFVAQKPAVAISFDPKVDWAMQDLGQSDLRLDIASFTAEDVMRGLKRLESRQSEITAQIASYRQMILRSFATQYDTLAQLASGR